MATRKTESNLFIGMGNALKSTAGQAALYATQSAFQMLSEQGTHEKLSTG